MRVRILLALFLTMTVFSVSAQDATSYIRTPGLGVNFLFNDFGSAAAIRANPVGSAIRDKKLSKISDMNTGLAISFVKGITNHLDFAASLGGSFLDYPASNGTILGYDGFLIEGDASFRAKMLSDNYYFVPYLSAGVGLSRFKNYYAANLPVGVGIQLNLFKTAFFVISSQYKLKITDNSNYHFTHSIGFIGDLPKGK